MTALQYLHCLWRTVCPFTAITSYVTYAPQSQRGSDFSTFNWMKQWFDAFTSVVWFLMNRSVFMKQNNYFMTKFGKTPNPMQTILYYCFQLQSFALILKPYEFIYKIITIISNIMIDNIDKLYCKTLYILLQNFMN